jgi:hypothetical protein
VIAAMISGTMTAKIQSAIDTMKVATMSYVAYRYPRKVPAGRWALYSWIRPIGARTGLRPRSPYDQA